MDSVVNADQGAGIFSFSTAHGVRLLLNDDDFTSFLKRSSFELIVGIDAVTVPAPLDLLLEAQREYYPFRVRAFLNLRRGTLFNPKMCWFATPTTGRVLVGSANLTRGGLLNNWEALGDATLSPPELADLQATWGDWIRHNHHNLRTLDDSHVVARARQNEAQSARRHEEDHVETADTISPISPGTDDVLIAEIPKASVRWNQANFDRTNFQTFFELQPGIRRRVVLFPVDLNGPVDDPEVRPSVDVKSHNYRLELGQAAGIPYPINGRPIAVFLRLATRRFRYRLLLPEQAHYARVARLLASRTTPPPGQVRRLRLSYDDLRRLLPNILFL